MSVLRYSTSIHPCANVHLSLKPIKHASFFFGQPASLYNYLSAGPFVSQEDFTETFWNRHVVPNRGAFTTFAIFDKTRSAEDDAASFAGMASYMNASAVDLCVEIGFIVILPAFQRTHVTTHMVGTLAQYAMKLPAEGGLGLRRLVWQCSSVNAPSVNAAKRLGFQYEGTLRWRRVVASNKTVGANGKPVRRGDPKEELPSRDTTILSICCDDWEDGKQKHIENLMAKNY